MKGFKKYGILFAALMAAVLFCGSAFAVPASPYLLVTSADLAWFRDQVNQGETSADLCAMLIADIDLGGIENEWIPIGINNSIKFKGKFDGGGHTISGLYISKPDETMKGLFGVTASPAEIKNLTVSGDITGKVDVGMIVGLNDGGTITGCTASGAVKGTGNKGSHSIGGICGTTALEGTVEKCVSTCDVTSGDIVGGILGTNKGGTIKGCKSSGKIASNAVGTAGGIVGVNLANGNIISCDTECDVKGSEGGGIAGGQYAGSIEDCDASSSTVYGTEYAGGLVGVMTEAGKVKNSIAPFAGSVTGGENAKVGKFIGSDPDAQPEGCEVAPSPAPAGDDDSSGCNAGFAGMLLLLALPLIAKRKD